MSQKLLLSDEWYQSLAAIITEIGEDNFCSSFARVCEGLTGYDSTVVLAFVRDEKPVLVFSNLSALDESPTLGPYFDGAYLLVWRRDLPDRPDYCRAI